MQSSSRSNLPPVLLRLPDLAALADESDDPSSSRVEVTTRAEVRLLRWAERLSDATRRVPPMAVLGGVVSVAVLLTFVVLRGGGDSTGPSNPAPTFAGGDVPLRADLVPTEIAATPTNPPPVAADGHPSMTAAVTDKTGTNPTTNSPANGGDPKTDARAPVFEARRPADVQPTPPAVEFEGSIQRADGGGRYDRF